VYINIKDNEMKISCATFGLKLSYLFCWHYHNVRICIKTKRGNINWCQRRLLVLLKRYESDFAAGQKDNEIIARNSAREIKIKEIKKLNQ